MSITLSLHYVPVAWHCTTEADKELSAIGIGLRHGPGDRVLRVRLSLADCRSLASTLTEALQRASEPAATDPGRSAL